MVDGSVRIPIAPIYLEHFDEGIIRALGGVLESFVLGGEEAQFYAVAIPGLCGPWPDEYLGRTPIFFGKSPLHPNVIPSITIIRTGIEDDLPRVAHKTLDHIVPAHATRRATVTRPDGRTAEGFEKVNVKEAAWPVNISYNVQIKARTEVDFLRMFRWVTRHLRAQDLESWITVWDSAKVPRKYDIFRESMSDIGEYVDVNDVVKAYEFSYRVEGEIDIDDPQVAPTVRDVRTTTQPLEG